MYFTTFTTSCATLAEADPERRALAFRKVRARRAGTMDARGNASAYAIFQTICARRPRVSLRFCSTSRAPLARKREIDDRQSQSASERALVAAAEKAVRDQRNLVFRDAGTLVIDIDSQRVDASAPSTIG